jgi:hypothetical protein
MKTSIARSIYLGPLGTRMVMFTAEVTGTPITGYTVGAISAELSMESDGKPVTIRFAPELTPLDRDRIEHSLVTTSQEIEAVTNVVAGYKKMASTLSSGMTRYM